MCFMYCFVAKGTVILLRGELIAAGFVGPAENRGRGKSRTLIT